MDRDTTTDEKGLEKAMREIFRCPHCKHVLNPNIKIILAAKVGHSRGLVLLSPVPGDYQFIADPELPIQDGEMASLCCPVCSESLVSPNNKQLCELIMEKGGPQKSRLQFSRVFGEHATFIIDGQHVEAFGENADDYNDVNFFGN
jgi:uncharacterized protein YbaR (Trm112 family)